MTNHQKTGNLLLFAGFAFCILQIWLPQYFLTGDGPCHLSNARILHDLWGTKNKEFYSRFFTIDYQPNPNWLSTLAMALLMFIVNGFVAEKIFLTLYVLFFVSGFALLLRKISNDSPYWPLVVFVFVFTYVLFKGFYNFSFSIAFYFWMIWSWLRIVEHANGAHVSLFILFTLLAFFTHLLAFVFGAFTCMALVASYTAAIATGTIKQKFTGYFLKYAGLLVLLLLPCIILMLWFTDKEGGMQVHPHFYSERIEDLVRFKYIKALDHSEGIVATITGVGLLILLIIGFTARLRKKIRINKYDGFFAALLFMIFVYLFFPEDFLGRLMLISMRVQLYVFIAVVCCITYMLPYVKLKHVAGIVLFGCFIALSVIRVPCLLAASRGAAAYMSATPYIKPNSVLLPFDFSPNGKDEQGKSIANDNWIFCHVAQYLTTKKPVVVLDNYEAKMGYFPLSWNDNVNPYLYLSRYEGIEGQPPYAVINEYREKTGVTIDYILMWCYDSSFLRNENFSKLYKEINDSYHIVYTTPGQRIILYARNSP